MTRSKHRKSVGLVALAGAAAALGALAGCDGASGGGLASRTEAVTPATDPLQFEAATDWHLTQGTVKSITTTTTHTQGAKALAVTAPSGYTRIESKALSSTHPQLAAINLGSRVSLDFLIPTLQANPFWFGAVQMYVSAPSRNVNNAYLGQVELTGMRTGIFTTLRFTIPDATVTALRGAPYSDLTFGIAINVPIDTKGVYLLDNLRTKSGTLPPRPTSIGGITPGQSILLEPTRTYSPAASTPASKTFTAGVVQIPQSFHVLEGGAGTGSATFEFKLGSAANTVCQYPFDPAAGGVAYRFGSCTGGARAGDLVPADFVRLTIVNGDAAAGRTKIRAQIALNPVGDEMPAGLPVIPTFFGTTGAEVRDALDAFVQQQRSWQINGDAVVRLPTPFIPIPPSTPPTVLPAPIDGTSHFERGDRLTHTDLADAGWHVTGNVSAAVDAQGARNTHFDLDAGIDAWLLTFEIDDVVGVSGFVDGHTPAFDGHTVPPSTGTASFCYRYLFFPVSCQPFDDSTGLNHPIVDAHPSVTILDQNYWVFHVGASANLDLTASLTGSFTPNGGYTIALSPHLGVSAQVEGGLSIGPFGGGGVFANFNLIGIDVPISASVDATLNGSPLGSNPCSVHVTESLTATAQITTGGGAIGYYIEAGLCCGCGIFEVCWRDQGDLYTFEGHSDPFTILPDTPLADQVLPLPAALCAPSGDGAGGIDYPETNEVFNAGDVSYLAAHFAQKFVVTIPGTDTHPSFPFPCSGYTWHSSDPSDVIAPFAGTSPNQKCFVQIKYGTAGPRTISVEVSDPALGSAAGSVPVSVTGDPATAPLVTITTPAALTVNHDCAGTLASGTATDPNGLAVDLEWFSGGDLFSLVSIGTGPTATLANITFVRLVGTNEAGQKAVAEIPVDITCVN